MCGITGYVGGRDSLPIIAASLKNLEYRGYDSAGVALQNGSLDVYKQAGEIDDLELPSSSGAHVGIGHTRWSTHGEPNDTNAHPHVDCTGRIAVVHNGIIENYVELKEELEATHTFTSETDTEVIPHLLEDALKGDSDLLTATQTVLERLDGSFAIAAVAADQEGIVVARQDSPLVVGHGDGERFVASDVPAFVEHTRRVTYLEDGDVAHITDKHVEYRNGGATVERAVNEIDWEPEAAEKGGYEHYMLKEIHEQPQALRQTLTGRLDEQAGDVNLELDLPTGYLQDLDAVQFVAAGTSYHAAMYGARLIEQLAGLPASATIASEYEFNAGRDPQRTLVIPVTQSGETADTLGATRSATAASARTLAVTNTVGGTVTRETDQHLLIRAGPEIGVAATKTFLTQVVTLTLLAVHLGRAREILSSQTASTVLSNLRRLPGAVQQVLDAEPTVRDVATEYAHRDAYFFIGRQLGHPVALEGALKLKEIAYVHAEGFPAGELKHGPLALVTPDTAVLAVLTDGANPRATLNNVKEVDARGASVIGLSSLADGESFLDTELRVPELGVLVPLLANVHCQLFAYHVAREHGRSIDKPRNLAKSVTVE